MCLADFMDWQCIHSRLVLSTHLVYCCPHRRVYCYPSTFSMTPPPSHSKRTIFCMSLTLCFGPDSEPSKLQHHTKKMTSKDEIYGLVSLKFLRPWLQRSNMRTANFSQAWAAALVSFNKFPKP
jgi:hypothetical protein